MARVLTTHHSPTLTEETARGREGYARFLKPRVLDVLETVGLDVAYDRAEGDYLWYRDAEGAHVRVLDLVGGFGASFLGHNHPALLARARAVLDEKRPFNAQASVRALAGRLAERLSEVVGRSTGREYTVTLASTGAEAVEAAIKHAEMDLVHRVDAIVLGIGKARRDFNLRSRAGTAHVPARTFERAARLLGGLDLKRADDLFARVEEHALLALHVEPTFIALERGFHGKSTGALSLTANPEYRTLWRRIGLRCSFLEPGDEVGLARAIDAARIPYLDFRYGNDGALELEEKELVNVAACFLEPIQGEGGVRPVSTSFLKAAREAADRGGFLLVLDEIQTGVGRTGTFLASEASGVRGEYVLLSKALGGGLAKVSALLVERDRSLPEFGMKHTSTFAEDDYSSAVALGVLDLLDAEDGAILRGCRARGDHLRKKLEALKAKWPGQIRDIRGAGLMIGLELADMDRSPSTFLRVASEQGLLGYVMAGYLLHEERIRVMPTLSSPGTIRIQPSALIATDDLDRFVEALDRLASAMHEMDTERLTRHLVGRARSSVQSARIGPDATPPVVAVSTPGARSVAFLGHFLDPEDVRDWDPGFSGLTDAECGRLVERTRRVLDPFVMQASTVRSRTGQVVDLTVIGVPFTSEQVMESFRKGDVAWARTMIDAAVALAKERGAKVIGFGGYTSIVTDNCRAVIDDEALVTSGNSLTSAATVDAVLKASERLGMRGVRLGIVGALGNIGAVLAELLAERVERIVLVGRKGAERRLSQREDELYAAALTRAASEGADLGIARALFASPLGREWKRVMAPADGDHGEGLDGFVQRVASAAMRDALERAMASGGTGLGAMIRGAMGPAAPIAIATDMSALRECNVIVAATNAPRPVILAEHVGPGPVVICDVAAPGDVHPDVAGRRRDVLVIKGGMVRLPLDQKLRVRGMPVAPGTIFGCLGETLLMGMAGVTHSLSVGALTASGVRLARDLALEHGFGFDEKPFHSSETG